MRLFPSVRLAGFHEFMVVQPVRGAVVSGQVVSKSLSESIASQVSNWTRVGSRMIAGAGFSSSSSDPSPTQKFMSVVWFNLFVSRADIVAAL